MRELTIEEQELIAGGIDTYGPSPNPEIIVVTADPGGGGGGDWGDWGDGGGGDNGDFGNDMPTPEPSPTYPAGFDAAMDDWSDSLAAQLGREIAVMPEVDKVEYGALIWKDAAGNLHTTTIERGTATTMPLDKLWSQVDLAGGGQVIGVIHSHPTLYNRGSAEAPIWEPRRDGNTLSSDDFDNMMDRAAGEMAGFDAANSRSYLVYGGTVTEYYAHDPDPVKYGGGGQATWAVPSKDYGK